jgi:hypothetical protein
MRVPLFVALHMHCQLMFFDFTYKSNSMTNLIETLYSTHHFVRCHKWTERKYHDKRVDIVPQFSFQTHQKFS